MTEASTAEAASAPLSVAQEALWYASRLAPTDITYNEVVSIRKQGPLDVSALRRAFNEIVRRHQAWRTTFDTLSGDPVQIVREKLAENAAQQSQLPPPRVPIGVTRE